MYFDKLEIDKKREYIRAHFLDLYQQNGFKIQAPLPLRIDYDPSLSFVNCSICLFKKQYFEGKKLQKYCVSQPALRSNTFKATQNNDGLLYTASLEMLGAFSPVTTQSLLHELNNHFVCQAKFLHDIFQSSKICVNIPKFIFDLLLPNTLTYLSALNVEITKIIDAYWRYGVDEITGVGSTWFVNHKGQIGEFGNIIILSKDDTVIGIESGGSIEALIKLLFDLPHKIYANTYATDYIIKRISENIQYSVEYYDSLDVVLHILFYYGNDLKIQLNPILERYVRIIKSYLIINEIPADAIKEDVMQIASTYSFCGSCPESLYFSIQDLMNTMWDVNVILKNRIKKKNIKWRGLNNMEIEAIRHLMKS